MRVAAIDEKAYRKGAIGALMDEFERVCEEFVQLIDQLTDADFEALRDPHTQFDGCRSIQKVANHVVQAGYAHTNHLRVAFSLPGSRVDVPLGTRTEVGAQVAAMLTYTEATLEGRWEMTDEQIEAIKIKSRWETVYDPEQMLEHAIVHVLRHRRQIERFLREPQFVPPPPSHSEPQSPG